MCMFVLSIGGDPKDMELAIKNYEVDDAVNAGCPLSTGCNSTYLSCRYLKQLETKNLNMVRYLIVN